MNFTIEHADSKRETFGDYRYRIHKDGRLVAHYWHDYRGDEHGIEFVEGSGEDWPFGRMTEFIQGGGPQPLALSERGVAYLSQKTGAISPTISAPEPTTIAAKFQNVIGQATALPDDMATQHDHHIHGSPKR